MRLLRILWIGVALAGCTSTMLLSKSPFNGAVVGFSYTQLSDSTYRVMYVIPWGSSDTSARPALERQVGILCAGAYAIKDWEDRITLVSHQETEGGVSSQAVAQCHRVTPNNSFKPKPLRGSA